MALERLNWPLIGVLLLNFLIWAIVLIPVVNGLRVGEADRESFTGKVKENILTVTEQTSHHWPLGGTGCCVHVIEI